MFGVHENSESETKLQKIKACLFVFMVVLFINHALVSPLKQLKTVLDLEFERVTVRPEPLPLWVYLASALGGVAILCISIGILWAVCSNKHIIIHHLPITRVQSAFSYTGNNIVLLYYVTI